MKYIVPFSPVSDKTMGLIKQVYESCIRKKVFIEPNRIQITNYFIDDINDFNLLIEHVVKPTGVNPDDVGNMWNDVDPKYNCKGINFNVMRGGDFLKPHCDGNPTKLNILVSGKTKYCIKFVGEDDSESYNWDTPALVDVSKKHYVDDIEASASDRIMLQIFIKKSFDYYKNIINVNPNW
jgi:hypothetical protein